LINMSELILMSICAMLKWSFFYVNEDVMRYLPTDVSAFSIMINDNYVYVDKTEYIYKLFGGGTRYYFLSRPRRFGKSLLISTLKELFLGNRELFKGLWIDSSDYKWQKYSVIHIDFSVIAHDSPEQLYQALSLKLQDIGLGYGIDVSSILVVQSQFEFLVKELAKKNKVVILIDEYDKPILDSIASTEKATLIRNALSGFYGVLKGLDEHIRAVFITGVTKFARTSIFSGLNNLNDISLDGRFDALLGYTHNEILINFDYYLEQAAQHNRCSADELLIKITEWYNGYLFSEDRGAIKIYNPFSLLLFLLKKKFSNYWFASGTPTFLMELIKKRNFPVIDIDNVVATESELGSFTIENLSVKTVLFQTGYLTIDHYDEETEAYHLRIPNYEVRASFFNYLLNSFTSVEPSFINDLVMQIVQSLKKQDIDKFCHLLQSFFASIPSNIQISLERYYQTVIFVLAKIIGLRTNVEVVTNIGRIDMIIEMGEIIYVFEFKIVGDAQGALEQIEERHYYQQYLNMQKSIILVGILFDVKKRNIDSWVVKNIDI